MVCDEVEVFEYELDCSWLVEVEIFEDDSVGCVLRLLVLRLSLGLRICLKFFFLDNWGDIVFKY